MGANLAANYVQAVAMVLFVIGFANLLLQKNLLKKIIGFNIMDSGTYLIVAAQLRPGNARRQRKLLGNYFRRARCRAHRDRRNSGGGEVHKPHPQRPRAHRYRSQRICHGSHAVAHRPPLQEVPLVRP